VELGLSDDGGGRRPEQVDSPCGNFRSQARVLFRREGPRCSSVAPVEVEPIVSYSFSPFTSAPHRPTSSHIVPHCPTSSHIVPHRPTSSHLTVAGNREVPPGGPPSDCAGYSREPFCIQDIPTQHRVCSDYFTSRRGEDIGPTLSQGRAPHP
jgi:hypothetical protein